MEIVYSSQKPLECCEFKNRTHNIGVAVYSYGDHFGVEGERATLDINTIAFGRSETSIKEAESQVIESTEHLVSHLDMVISELQSHRARLANELIVIRANGLKVPDVGAVEQNMQRTVGKSRAKKAEPQPEVLSDELAVPQSAQLPLM